MSEDEHDKSKKDNSAPKHKPTFASDTGYAPVGAVGLQVQSPGLGTTRTLYVEYEITEAAPQPEQSDVEKRTDYLDSLPENTVFTSVTGDKDIDQQSVDSGDVPVTEEEMDALQNPSQELEGPQISQSDFAKAFRQARGQSEQLQQGKDNDQELE